MTLHRIQFRKPTGGQISPAWKRVLHANTEKTEKALGQNRRRDRQSRINDDGAHQVREEMPDELALQRHSNGPRGFHEGLLTQTQDLPSDDPGHGQPAHSPDRRQQGQNIDELTPRLTHFSRP